MNTDGKILHTDLPPDKTLIGQDITGMYVGEILPKDEVRHFFDCMAKAMREGTALCPYEIGEKIFLARMERISDRRAKMIERNVTGLSFKQAVRLF